MPITKPTTEAVTGRRYYPNSHPQQLNDDLRVAYDHIYRLQDQLDALHRERKPAADGERRTTDGGPSTTKIAGLYVKGTPPKHQQVLMYNAESGQIEWGDIGP